MKVINDIKNYAWAEVGILIGVTVLSLIFSFTGLGLGTYICIGLGSAAISVLDIVASYQLWHTNFPIKTLNSQKFIWSFLMLTGFVAMFMFHFSAKKFVSGEIEDYSSNSKNNTKDSKVVEPVVVQKVYKEFNQAKYCKINKSLLWILIVSILWIIVAIAGLVISCISISLIEPRNINEVINGQLEYGWVIVVPEICYEYDNALAWITSILCGLMSILSIPTLVLASLNIDSYNRTKLREVLGKENTKKMLVNNIITLVVSIITFVLPIILIILMFALQMTTINDNSGISIYRPASPERPFPSIENHGHAVPDSWYYERKGDIICYGFVGMFISIIILLIPNIVVFALMMVQKPFKLNVQENNESAKEQVSK